MKWIWFLKFNRTHGMFLMKANKNNHFNGIRFIIRLPGISPWKSLPRTLTVVNTLPTFSFLHSELNVQFSTVFRLENIDRKPLSLERTLECKQLFCNGELAKIRSCPAGFDFLSGLVRWAGLPDRFQLWSNI